MSRVFRRPMFRGGSTNMNGIMSGIEDRENFQDGTPSAREQLEKAYSEYPDTGISPLNQFLIQGGLSLMSQPSTGSLLGDIATAAKDPTSQLLKSLSEKGRIKRELALQGTALDIEQAGKERLLKQRIDAEAAKQTDGIQEAIYTEQLTENLKNYPGMPEVAKNATDFQTKKSGELYKKVGPKAQGVITFDINDPAQVRNQIKEVKKLDGKIVYDPYQNNYKYIKINKTTKQPEVKTYGSIEEIPSGEEIDATETTEIIKEDQPTPGLFGQKTKPRQEIKPAGQLDPFLQNT